MEIRFTSSTSADRAPPGRKPTDTPPLFAPDRCGPTLHPRRPPACPLDIAGSHPRGAQSLACALSRAPLSRAPDPHIRAPRGDLRKDRPTAPVLEGPPRPARGLHGTRALVPARCIPLPRPYSYRGVGRLQPARSPGRAFVAPLRPAGNTRAPDHAKTAAGERRTAVSIIRHAGDARLQALRARWRAVADGLCGLAKAGQKTKVLAFSNPGRRCAAALKPKRAETTSPERT